MRLGLTASAISIAVILATGCASTEPEVEITEEHVVLLHGLGRSSASMRPLQQYFLDEGYHVLNLDYPSREKGIADLAGELDHTLAPLCSSEGMRLHFVTHSMGGVLLRYYLAHHECPSMGRVVMLSPPNQGTELVDRLGGEALFRDAAGPAARELGTGPDSIPSKLGPVDFELGVIIGNKSLNPIGSAMIPGEDDGTVAIESAKVEGMADFLVVPTSHSFIMMNADVMAQVGHFIDHGRFDRGEGGP